MKRYEQLAAKATKAAQASPDFWGWADLDYLVKEMIKITDDLLYNTKTINSYLLQQSMLNKSIIEDGAVFQLDDDDAQNINSLYDIRMLVLSEMPKMGLKPTKDFYNLRLYESHGVKMVGDSLTIKMAKKIDELERETSDLEKENTELKKLRNIYYNAVCNLLEKATPNDIYKLGWSTTDFIKVKKAFSEVISNA